jgi:hypothetical protein
LLKKARISRAFLPFTSSSSTLPSAKVICIAADVGENLVVHLVIEGVYGPARAAEIFVAALRDIALAAISAPDLAVTAFLRRFRYDRFSFIGCHD